MKPRIRVTTIAQQPVETDGYLAFLMERGVRFFQVFISPVDSDRCSAYPTCSAYGRQAFRTHGALWGYLLTFDRLLHEGNESMVSPYVFDGGRLRVFDPVENNTFWLIEKRR